MPKTDSYHRIRKTAEDSKFYPVKRDEEMREIGKWETTYSWADILSRIPIEQGKVGGLP
jgi:hypothetical protein